LREYTVVLAQPENDAHPPAKPIVQAHPPVSVKGEPAVERAHASVKHDEKAPVAAESLPSDGKTHTVYGPVKQGDTLGGIASNIVLPAGTSFNQMLVALHRANPDAFIGNNMHQLKAGLVLRIPDGGEIVAISPAEANKEVQIQTLDWNRRRFPPAAGEVEELKQTVTGKIDRTVEADSIAAREPAREVLRLSKGAEPWNADNNGMSGASGKGTSPGANPGEKQSEQPGARDRLQAMEEDVVAKSKALREANERIALLEKNIKELQQLLELKNLALADMQKRAEASRPGTAAVPAAVSIPPGAVSPQPESNPETAGVAQPLADAAAQPSSVGNEVIEPGHTAATSANPAGADKSVEIAKPVQRAKLTREPVPDTDAGARARSKGTGTIIDDLVANFEYLGGALVLLITGIVGVSMVRAPKSSSLFDSDEDSTSSAAPPRSQDKSQEMPESLPAHPAKFAHEAEYAPFTGHDPVDTALDMGEAQSTKIMKTESVERNTHQYEIINKIDLARAYQEMDDKDAARQILQEVIEEGDARQQESARLMLANL
ncbi:MAG: hypothetical protein KGM95_09255, partial [Betaproteobacteria bacterium]|nr:hypothetical protein [Betaproteobacteria bacterium]